ncbi:MAG TPA: hypothetical protein VE130_03320, partial [Nitrososphaeraceae archaeon]|nr:hypothetical protein [Nitrososphaeraceae archaeon]
RCISPSQVLTSSLNTSVAGIFRYTSLPLNPCTAVLSILNSCLPIISVSESLSIPMMLPMSSYIYGAELQTDPGSQE